MFPLDVFFWQVSSALKNSRATSVHLCMGDCACVNANSNYVTVIYIVCKEEQKVTEYTIEQENKTRNIHK